MKVAVAGGTGLTWRQQGKLCQEEIVRGGSVPWSVPRATQFHTPGPDGNRCPT